MDKLYYWIIDYIYRIKGEIQMYRYLDAPFSFTKNAKENKPPIILIPGLTLRWGFLKHIGDVASKLGYPVFIVKKLGNSFLPIPQSAELVWQVIKDNNLKNVIIIGHSKGGLIGKYLLIHYNSDQRIKLVIGIATPFSGTTLGKFIPHSSFKEMLVNEPVISEFMKNSNVNEKIISIYPSFDNHIWPQGSSRLEGAKKNVEMPVKGHHKIVFDKETKDTIIDCIKNI